MHSKTMQKTRLRRFFFIFSFFPSPGFLSFLFFFLDSTIDSALEKRLQFFTFSAQMAPIKQRKAGKAVEDALQYIKKYVAGVWTKTAKWYYKNVEEV